MLGVGPSSPGLFPLFLIRPLKGRCNPYPCFTGEETKAQKGEETCHRPRDSEVELGFDLWQDVSRACAL